jgi:membrane-bound inhibitor of C-type lysozyme
LFPNKLAAFHRVSCLKGNWNSSLRNSEVAFAMRKNCLAALLLALCTTAFALLTPGSVFAQSDEVFIINGDDTYVMVSVESASGEKYVALGGPNDAPIEFFSGGSEAELTINGGVCNRYVLIRGSANKEELFLTVDGKNYRMKQVRAASGARYQAVGDPKTELSGKGSSATLTVEGVQYSGYDTWQPLGRIWLPDSAFYMKK